MGSQIGRSTRMPTTRSSSPTTQPPYSMLPDSRRRSSRACRSERPTRFTWGLETNAETITAGQTSSLGYDGRDGAEALCRGVTCPAVVVSGTDDHISSHETAVRLAELTGGSLIRLENSGHAPQAREPV